MKRQPPLPLTLCLAIAAAVALAGCSAQPGPITPPEARLPGSAIEISSATTHADATGLTLIRTPHYAIYTGFPAPETHLALARVMEGAHALYAQLAPPQPGGDSRPLECWVFHNRGDWAEYTRQTTGTNAAVYLQIGRGGYTVSDRFAIYRATPDAAYMVAAHEGWHQYVARHWAQRLPPALEEGLACVFESLRVEQGIPQWTLTRNVNRLGALRWALETDELWPLDELIGMHAGQVVALPPQRVELFYGQCWALARMLLEEGEWAGETAPLPRLVADAAAGRLEGLTGASVRGRQRAQARPLLERYTGRSLEQLQAQYDRYVRELVQD